MSNTQHRRSGTQPHFIKRGVLDGSKVKWSDVLRMKRVERDVQQALPLLLKKNTPIDKDAVMKLSVQHPELKTHLAKLYRLLENEEEYEAAPLTVDPQVAKLSEVDLNELLEHAFTELSPAGNTAPAHVGSTNTFCRPEMNKVPPRRRVLSETAYNEVMKTALQLRYSTRREHHLNAAGNDAGGTYSIQFDMTAYFNAFVLGQKVRRFHTFRGVDGLLYQLTRLPMGSTTAPAIAQVTTWVLIDFPMKARVDTMIDNIRFCGTKQDVIDAAMTFLERIDACNLTLNDDEGKCRDAKAIEGLLVREDTFLGDKFDYANHRVCTGDKTIAKLRASRENAENWTNRQFAAHFALLVYSSYYTNVAKYFDVIRTYRGIASICAMDARRWDEQCQIFNPAAWNQLVSWTEKALANEWVQIHTTLPRVNRTIYVDSCGDGWGAVCITAGGGVQIAHGRFPYHIAHSAHAEPNGVKAAVARFAGPKDDHVLVVTDHTPIMYAAAAGWARGRELNSLLDHLESTYEHMVFSFQWISGERHVVSDRLSRLKNDQQGDITEEERENMTRDAKERASIKTWEETTTTTRRRGACRMACGREPWMR